MLRFDTIDSDTDGYASASLPIDRLVIPSGLGGLYLLVATSNTSGNQANSLGMGVLVNGTLRLSPSNQYINGPGNLNYSFTATPVQIGYLQDGDQIQLFNTSQSAGTNPFTNVFLALTRLG